MGPGEVVLTIRRDEVESLLLAACPSFVASPDRLKYQEDYDGEEEPLVSGHRASSDTIEDHGS
jgi:hypothetical protein